MRDSDRSIGSRRRKRKRGSTGRSKPAPTMGEAAPADSSSAHLQNKETATKRDRPMALEEEDDEGIMNWEGYLRLQHSGTTFAQYYRCRAMSLLGVDAAAGYDDGNRVFMPQSALDRLGSVEVEYPLVFKIQNAATPHLATHVGVQEFVAEEGFVHVPAHTMARLGLLHPPHTGAADDHLVLLKSTSLPKATSVKLQPHTSDFLRVKHPRELLEYSFSRYYRCVTVGDTITVADGHARYLLDVVGAAPAQAVSTNETDCEVDFLPPLDYKERPKKLVPESRAEFTVRPGEARTVGFLPTDPLGHVLLPRADVTAEGPFSGVGMRLDGTPVDKAPPPTVPAAGPSTFAKRNMLRFGGGGGASVPATGKSTDGQGDGRFSGVGMRMDGTPVEVEPPPPVVPATGPWAKGSNIIKNMLRFGGGTPAPATGKKTDGQGEGRFSGIAMRMDGTPVDPSPPVVPTAGPSVKGTSFKNMLLFGGGGSGKKTNEGEKDKEAGRFTGHKYSMED